ncbi:hypothetical protein GCM10027034_16490 [Ramlibacter solisilvae]|uniref:VanZ-like domain-containing protein n=1 Tax=Ramlibacter tataouinensis TaxID=94132 RepID=A0A127JVZ2_9BURK|nr:hypothetical protein [Ramlibacter tataouinensis]AMO24167.1 hypothetical protein UC35_16645 [Ramlibacter tataouinensis]
MRTQQARFLTLALVVALLTGTLMPGSWKHAALDPLQSPIDLSAIAHVVLFAAITAMLPLARFWDVTHWHLAAAGLALALLTEGLQFFAIDRHPNLAGVAQDMAGVLLGWLLLLRIRTAAAVSRPPR